MFAQHLVIIWIVDFIMTEIIVHENGIGYCGEQKAYQNIVRALCEICVPIKHVQCIPASTSCLPPNISVFFISFYIKRF